MKKYKFPKDRLVQPEDQPSSTDGFVDDKDVEGHGLPITAPPGIDVAHGGEAIPSGDDDEAGPTY